MASEQESFLKDLDIKTEDVFDKPIEGTDNESEPKKEEGFEPKNRRERRLLTQNQRLREEAIASAARLEGISEAQKFAQEAGEDDPLKAVEAVFGTDTPEKLAATNILKQALAGMSESAVQRSLEKIEERESASSQAVTKEEDNIERMLEDVEDDTDLDLSPGSPDRRAFLAMLEKASPKDRDGNIIEYADPDYVAEQYVAHRGNGNSRAKELASRSRTASGASQSSTLEEDANWRILKDIIG